MFMWNTVNPPVKQVQFLKPKYAKFDYTVHIALVKTIVDAILGVVILLCLLNKAKYMVSNNST
jgi:hypothetical protein